MEAKSVADQIREIKMILDTPDKWIQGDLALTAQGLLTHPTSKMACRFCLIGAAARVIGGRGPGCRDHYGIYSSSDVGRAIADEVHRSMPHLQNRDLTSATYAFNDRATFEEVHKLLDRALARAEGATA